MNQFITLFISTEISKFDNPEDTNNWNVVSSPDVATAKQNNVSSSMGGQ